MGSMGSPRARHNLATKQKQNDVNKWRKETRVSVMRDVKEKRRGWVTEELAGD